MKQIYFHKGSRLNKLKISHGKNPVLKNFQLFQFLIKEYIVFSESSVSESQLQEKSYFILST